MKVVLDSEISHYFQSSIDEFIVYVNSNKLYLPMSFATFRVVKTRKEYSTIQMFIIS